MRGGVGRQATYLADFIFQAQSYDAAQRASVAFERCRFRDGFLAAFGEMSRFRELYISVCEGESIRPSSELLREFIGLQAQLVSVCCPHCAEEVWQVILAEPAR